MYISNNQQFLCPICLGTSMTRVGPLDFSDWKDRSQDELERVFFRFEMVQCTCCGHVMAQNPYGEDFISHINSAQQTDGDWGEACRDNYFCIHKDMTLFCKDHLPKDGLIVDFGTGLGHLLHTLKSDHHIKNERLLGVDFSNTMETDIPFLAANLNDIENQNLPSFDFAFITHVLEHIIDPRSLMRGLATLAKKGAKLYLEVPDANNYTKDQICKTTLYGQQHIHHFSMNNLIALSESTGWTVIKQGCLVTELIPRARLLLQRNDLSEAKKDAIAALAYLKKNQDSMVKIIEEYIQQGPLALWGVGADLALILKENESLITHIKSGQISLYDRDWQGRSYYGATIRPSSALKDCDRPILITPRPFKTYKPMLDHAIENGYQHKLIKRG